MGVVSPPTKLATKKARLLLMAASCTRLSLGKKFVIMFATVCGHLACDLLFQLSLHSMITLYSFIPDLFFPATHALRAVVE